jgi:hypothetical protein
MATISTGKDDPLPMSTHSIPQTGPDAAAPDFLWPDRVCLFILSYLSAFWNYLVEKAGSMLLSHPFLSKILKGLGWLLISYLFLLWLSLCYVTFPVYHFGIGIFIRWAALVFGLLTGTVCAVFGFWYLLMILSFLLLLVFYLILSGGYLTWILWNATHKQDIWLQNYRLAIPIGVGIVLALSVVVDGSYRYWDSRFNLWVWLKIAFFLLSAWCALFCWLARDKVLQPSRPRMVLIWTLCLAVGIGSYVGWKSREGRDEYFLRKNVNEHPNSGEAWLSLGWHYYSEANRLADEPEEGEHAPPNPTPSYKEALKCFNRAVELGRTGLHVNLARAYIAYRLNMKKDSIGFAREGLKFAYPMSEHQEDVAWIQNLIDLNTNELAESGQLASPEDRERKKRIENLPGSLRWVFEMF